LPAQVSFLYAVPSNSFTVVGRVVTFANLGVVPNLAQTNVTIYVRPQSPGQITNSASIGSATVDPFKANNSASVKTVVEALQLTVSRSGNNFIISWPADATGFVLESTPNLRPPIAWTVVTNPPAVQSGGQMTVTVGTTNVSRFFRLHGTGP